MYASFRSAFLSLARDRATLFWTLLFPIFLSTLFLCIDSGVETSAPAISSTVAVAETTDLSQAPGLEEVLDAASADGSGEKIVELVRYADENAAEKAARSGAADAYLTLSQDGIPELHVGPHAEELAVSVLQEVLDTYLHVIGTMKAASAAVPDAASPGAVLSAFASEAQKTVRISYTQTAPDPFVRYYYALLAMSAGFGTFFSMAATKRLVASASALGARQTMSAIPRWKMLAGALLAAFLCQLACLSAAVLYMHLVCGVDFGGRIGYVLLALVLSALLAGCAGAFAGTFLHVEPGLISGVVCLLSLFCGLYGEPSQRIADAAESAFPLLAQLNPLWQIVHAFFALLYYATLDAFFRSCLVLLAMCGAFFVLAACRMRRMSYAEL